MLYRKISTDIEVTIQHTFTNFLWFPVLILGFGADFVHYHMIFGADFRFWCCFCLFSYDFRCRFWESFVSLSLITDNMGVYLLWPEGSWCSASFEYSSSLCSQQSLSSIVSSWGFSCVLRQKEKLKRQKRKYLRMISCTFVLRMEDLLANNKKPQIWMKYN